MAESVAESKSVLLLILTGHDIEVQQSLTFSIHTIICTC